MRGADSFDGKISGNRQLVDRYNEAKGKKGSLKPALKQARPERPKTAGGESGGAREAGGHDEIKQVVAEHGKAMSHHVYDRGEGAEGGRYHTVTQHEDGHVHSADHDTIADAHEHAAIAHEDTGHMGDMGKEDYQVAREGEREEDTGGRTSNVGFMS
jgi:hypothetical protein